LRELTIIQVGDPANPPAKEWQPEQAEIAALKKELAQLKVLRCVLAASTSTVLVRDIHQAS
jgi:hypothetical protein